MDDLIRRSALLQDIDDTVRYTTRDGMSQFGAEIRGANKVIARIEAAPAVDAVDRAVYEQVAWERDTALAQLSDIGKGLGEKMDDVAKVVRCPKCVHSDHNGTYCKLDKNEVHPSYFCGRGQRREDGDA